MSEQVKDYPPYLDYPKPRKKQTNADRIRAMTDEKLALLAHILEAQSIAIGACFGGKALSVDEWLEVLKQEVSDNG